MADFVAEVTPAFTDRYRIERQLGHGGMATVYLAEDERHHRKVAIKVLHPELSAILGSDRFLKEIELTANLQHPHILPLFDSGSVNGHLYYVMPYIPGESLRARLERERQLPIADVIRIATEIADALEYAHQRGVVHRDIKPENILLQGDHCLVADFGIALAVEQAGGGERMTQTGLSLGTPQYMSPEQTMGEREVGPRADLYSLGIVTYEMLVGEPPFTGPTAQATVAKMMTEEPRRLIPQRGTVPPAVEDAVLTALERLPADRHASAAAFAQALAAPAPARHRGRVAPRYRTWIGLAVAAAALSVGTFFVGRLTTHRSPIAEFGRSTKITWERGLQLTPTLSPDGRSVAYAGGTSMSTHIYMRPAIGGRATRLDDDSLGPETSPTWSSDGTRLLFLANGGAYSVPSSGGHARAELQPTPRGLIYSAAWAPDGESIAYAVRDSIYIRSSAGHVRPAAMVPDASMCRWSPDGGRIACVSQNSDYARIGLLFGNRSPSQIVVARVKDGVATPVTDDLSINQSPAWSPDGQWLYFISNRQGPQDLYAQRVSGAGTPSGLPVRLTTGLEAHTFSVSADGTRFAYEIYTATGNVWSLPFPPKGATEADAKPMTTGLQVVEEVSASTDGRWLLYDSNVSGVSHIYRQRLPTGDPEPLTSGPSDDFSPFLSPDGREVAFHSWRSGSRDIWVLPLDGGPLQQATTTPEQESAAYWSPDGKALTFVMFGYPGGVWVVHRAIDRSWGQPVQRTTMGSSPSWSPDGRLIAYTTSLYGGYLAVVGPDSGLPRAVYDTTGNAPRAEQAYWSSDSKTIYFQSHDAQANAMFWSVPAAGGKPMLLLRFDDPSRPAYRPLWGLGGGRMYFVIDERQSQVWVMDAVPR
jgi:serine/threonine protein kinase